MSTTTIVAFPVPRRPTHRVCTMPELPAAKFQQRRCPVISLRRNHEALCAERLIKLRMLHEAIRELQTNGNL